MSTFLLSICLIYLVSSTPNIIFILNDDWGWNDVSFHGACDFGTPRIDDLAATGMELTNYYVQNLCTPTRSTIMSGRYPIRDGLQQAVIYTAAPYGLPLNLTILPQELKRAGYATHMVGKWHLGFFREEYLPTSRGWDTFVGFYGGEEDYFTKNFSDDGHNGYDLRNGTRVLRDYRYSTDIYRDESLRIMKKHVAENRQNPFFLYLPFQAPHAPFQAPKSVIEGIPFIKGTNRRKLAGAMAVLDDSIGQIVDYLKSAESGYLWDDTLLIISSDNGGDTNYRASNYPLRGSKGTLYEGGVKAIGIVNGGWLNDDLRGTQMNALMHSTDWFVTLQSIAGIEPSVDYLLDGLDQTDNLMNGNGLDIYNPREVLLYNAHEVNGALRYRDWKLIRPSDLTNSSELDKSLDKQCHSVWCENTEADTSNPTVRCWDENYDHPMTEYSIHGFQSGCSYDKHFCLFNIRNDPCEFNNIVDGEHEIYIKMKEMFEQFQGEAASPLFAIYPEDFDAADPVQFNGVWSPWLGFNDDSERELLALQETAVTQHLSAPSIVFLVIFGVLMLILQTATLIIKRNEEKARLTSDYGAV